MSRAITSWDRIFLAFPLFLCIQVEVCVIFFEEPGLVVEIELQPPGNQWLIPQPLVASKYPIDMDFLFYISEYNWSINPISPPYQGLFEVDELSELPEIGGTYVMLVTASHRGRIRSWYLFCMCSRQFNSDLSCQSSHPKM